MGATHILCSAAHPTSARSLQMGHHLKGTIQAFQRYKIYCQKHCYHREIINQTQMSLLFVPSLYIYISFLSFFFGGTNRPMKTWLTETRLIDQRLFDYKGAALLVGEVSRQQVDGFSCVSFHKRFRVYDIKARHYHITFA